MKKQQIILFVNLLAKTILIITIFALPLFFLPVTVDIFEFPKQILLWTAVLLLIILTILKFLVDGEVKFLKNPLLLPILLFLIVYFTSAALSPERYLAFLGFFGRPNSGLISVFAYFAIFYFVSFYFEQLKEIFWVVWAVLTSIFVLSILAIFYYFGIFLIPLEIIKTNAFSPAGGLFPLSQILAASIPLLLGVIFYLKTAEYHKTIKILQLGSLYLVLLTITTALILTNTLTGWVGLGVGVTAFLVLVPFKTIKKMAIPTMALALFLILAGVFTQTPFFRSEIPVLNVNLEKPQSPNLLLSWQVAAGALRDHPILGSGPASFLSDFTKYRPVELNLTNAWSLRFVQSGSLYLDIIATTGILGIVTFLFIIAKFLQYAFQTLRASRFQPIFPLKLGLVAGVLGFLASFLFYSFSTTAFFVFTLILGLIFALEKISGSTLVSEIKFAATIAISFLIILLLASVLGFWGIIRVLTANISFQKVQSALTRNDLIEAENLLAKSASHNPFEDTYWRELARINLFKTLQTLQQPDITDEGRQQALNSFNLSVQHARKATQLAPRNVTNWEILGDIYAAFANQIQNASDLALEAYTRAILLDPPNPNLWLKAGNLLSQTGNLDQVIETAKQAVRLKPNLIDARFYLARALELKGDLKQAEIQYQTAKNLTQSLEEIEVRQNLLKQINQRLEIIKDRTATPSATPN